MSYHEREEALAKEGRNISSLYDLLNDPVAKKYGIQVEEHEFSEKTFSYLKSIGGGVAVGSILGYFFSVLWSARAKPAPSPLLMYGIPISVFAGGNCLFTAYRNRVARHDRVLLRFVQDHPEKFNFEPGPLIRDVLKPWKLGCTSRYGDGTLVYENLKQQGSTDSSDS